MEFIRSQRIGNKRMAITSYQEDTTKCYTWSISTTMPTRKDWLKVVYYVFSECRRMREQKLVVKTRRLPTKEANGTKEEWIDEEPKSPHFCEPRNVSARKELRQEGACRLSLQQDPRSQLQPPLYAWRRRSPHNLHLSENPGRYSSVEEQEKEDVQEVLESQCAFDSLICSSALNFFTLVAQAVDGKKLRVDYAHLTVRLIHRTLSAANFLISPLKCVHFT
uniref:Uncharacterized protein n=1 Tax=Ditylenchus dipsaci TaxID=166011 RepID=A0A915D6H3_9BILA